VPWRVYHGLDRDFRPLDDPSAPPHRIHCVDRYRKMMYGFALATDVLEHGAKDRPGPPAPRRGETVRPSGLILPG
jgi:hypothetical protein